MNRSLLLGLILLSAVACTTAPNHPSRVVTAPDVEREMAALREAMMSDLEAMTSTPDMPQRKGPAFDAEAIASIEIPSHPSVDSAIRYFSTGLKKSIQTSLTRSAKYKTSIDQILDQHGVPRAFAYLPVIESAYLPHLTSKAGARGMWQFMPATAREYGLRVDWWVDERIDVEKSTWAAARYLRDLHRMFADWPLVLAAYNAGPGRVRRTLREHEATSFWQLLDKSALPKETRGYVPTFFATVAIVGNPERFGFELHTPFEGTDTDWDTVEIHGPLSLEFLGELCGAPLDALKAENGIYHRGIVPPGPNRVRVPRKAVAGIRERAESLHQEDPIVEVASYTLKPGESVTDLSKSIGVSVDDVLAMNRTRDDRFGPGDSVYFPVRQTTLSSRLLDRRATPSSDLYVVSKGDTLYSIAKRYSLTLDQLRTINDLPGDAVIQPGQRIRVSAQGGTTAGGM